MKSMIKWLKNIFSKKCERCKIRAELAKPEKKSWDGEIQVATHYIYRSGFGFTFKEYLCEEDYKSAIDWKKHSETLGAKSYVIDGGKL